MEKSRLKSNLKQRAYRNVILATLGVIIIFALLIIFGTQILVGFSLLAGKLTGNDDHVATSQDTNYIAPPQLDPAVEATNSAKINISGTATYEEKINLYNNNKLIDSTRVKNDNSFIFSNISLSDGENILKAKVVTNDNKQSAYSEEITILRLNKEPSLEVQSPTEGQKFKKEESPIKVIGKTDPNVKVTVNDFWAIADGMGNYSYSYNLRDGDNTLKIVATDLAGNKTTKEVKIHSE